MPLGFGRVYVQLDGGGTANGAFNHHDWLRGLDAGRSFVTTGPMLFVEVNGKPPGSTIKNAEAVTANIRVLAVNEAPLDRIELVVGGKISQTIRPINRRTERGAFESPSTLHFRMESSTWIAVRAFEKREENRVRFAHSSPIFIDIEGKPLRPSEEEVDFLIGRVEKQIDNSKDVLPAEAIAEYRQALQAYRGRLGKR